MEKIGGVGFEPTMLVRVLFYGQMQSTGLCHPPMVQNLKQSIDIDKTA